MKDLSQWQENYNAFITGNPAVHHTRTKRDSSRITSTNVEPVDEIVIPNVFPDECKGSVHVTHKDGQPDVIRVQCACGEVYEIKLDYV